MSHPFDACPNREQCRALVEGQVRAPMTRGHRTARSVLHGAVAVGLLAAAQAVYTAASSGTSFDVKVLVLGAVQAGLAAGVAYLHKAPTDGTE